MTVAEQREILARLRRQRPHLKLDGVYVEDSGTRVSVPLDVWNFLIDLRETDLDPLP